jgi:hypothetical protein
MYVACGASESGITGTAVQASMYPARPAEEMYFGYFDRAKEHYNHALSLRPSYVEAASHLGALMLDAVAEEMMTVADSRWVQSKTRMLSALRAHVPTLAAEYSSLNEHISMDMFDRELWSLAFNLGSMHQVSGRG